MYISFCVKNKETKDRRYIKGDITHEKTKVKNIFFFLRKWILDLGFEMNGFEIQFVNEFHPAFMNAYQYSREKMGLSKPIYGIFSGRYK